MIASRVMSIGFQMTIPPVIGWWVDSKLQTTPWLLVLGTILGFSISMLELVKLAKDSEDSGE